MIKKVLVILGLILSITVSIAVTTYASWFGDRASSDQIFQKYGYVKKTITKYSELWAGNDNSMHIARNTDGEVVRIFINYPNQDRDFYEVMLNSLTPFAELAYPNWQSKKHSNSAINGGRYIDFGETCAFIYFKKGIVYKEGDPEMMVREAYIMLKAYKNCNVEYLCQTGKCK